MKLVTASVAEDHAYLLPLGDIHIGDKAFGKAGRKKLKGYIEWALEHPNSRVFLMGDIYNVASRTSKTSPFESSASEYQEALEIFHPVRGQIIGVITGNHENRMQDAFGFNPLVPFCAELGVPYLGYSAIIRFKVGLRTDTGAGKGAYRQVYHLYAHHTTGGGGGLGASINRKVKLQELVQGVDAYLGGHSHQMVTGFRTVFEPGQRDVVERKVAYIDTGSFLDWKDSYAEAGQLSPGKLGAPRIRLDGRKDKHDLHVSM